MRTEIITSHQQTMMVDLLGTQLTTSIDCQRVQQVKKFKRKKLPPTSLFLLGFDTEYQTTDPVDIRQVRSRQITPKNELLSYQYSLKRVTSDPEQGGEQVSGLIIPPANGKRLPLNQFVAFAIGDWMRQFPDTIAPRDIYLIGHFTRADLPAFDQFSATARSFTSNLRNTFVSIDSSIDLRVEDEPRNILEVFNVRLRDTLLMAPANAKSLADIGEIVGLSKIKLAETAKEELLIKQNMAELRSSNWQLFRDYAIRDADVCVLYAERMIRQQQNLFSEFKLPVTLTSFGTKLVLQGWQQSKINHLDILGRELKETKYFSQKLNRFISKTSTPFVKNVYFLQDFVTETYHGGRNEQFFFGIAPEGDWRDLDLSSAYTTAMSIIGFPNWNNIRRTKNLATVNYDDLGFFEVNFEFPKSIRFPVLPVRTANGLIFPRKGTSYCSTPELWLARQLGCQLEVNEGWVVETDTERPVFLDFIQQSIKTRALHPKGSFDNLFWKEVGNSTYGKTAQGMRKKRIYNLKDDTMVELPESELTQPFFASFITSYTRAVLGEILNTLPPEAHVFSVTTDGFLTTATDDHISVALEKPLCRSFQTARQKLVGDNQVLEQKHHLKQPVGWRTRGSATLVPGDGKDGIVLQKGGIKTPYDIPREIENEYIIDLFFNRTGDQLIEYTIGLGIRDMVNFEADFVSRQMTKTLRMEFDWKRKPIDPKDITINFNGQWHTHLSFDTAPWESVRQFERIRTNWDNYNAKTKSCLKTRSDMKQFFSFDQLQKSPDNVKKYLKKNNGDLNRLARDLCRAIKWNEAGFEQLPADSKLRMHKKFIAACKSCGIPATNHMLDYAKQTDFVPHQSIDTEAAVRAATLFRDTYFVGLRLDRLFPVKHSA